MKPVLAVAALALVVAGCSTPHQPKAAAGDTSATPTPVASTAKPSLPVIEPRLTVNRDVPWHRVGADWHLVMTVSGRRGPDGIDPDRARLQLLDPAGRRTDVVVMDRDVLGGAEPPRWGTWVPEVEDFASADRTVLLRFWAARHAATVVALDLVTGDQRSVRVPSSAGAVALREGGLVHVRSGQRVVSLDPDGTTTVLGRGDATLLPLPGRTAVVTGHPLQVLGLDGSRRALAEPDDRDGCSPRRWWDGDTVLATCSDDSLWLVPLGDGAPRMVTREADPHSGVMDFGADDAVQLDGTTYVQKNAGCGAGWVARANPDGTTTDLDGRREQRLVGVEGGRLLVQRSTPCGHGTDLVMLDPATLEVEPLLTPGRHEQVYGLWSSDLVPALVR